MFKALINRVLKKAFPAIFNYFFAPSRKEQTVHFKLLDLKILRSFGGTSMHRTGSVSFQYADKLLFLT